MKTISILTMCVFLISLMGCKEKSDTTSRDEMPHTSENGDVGYQTKTLSADKRIDSTAMGSTWKRDLDKDMDITSMYGDLNMTDKQISDYEASSKAYRDRMSNMEKDVPAGNQAILVHRDSSLQTVLTPEQYKKYQEMVKERKAKNN